MERVGRSGSVIVDNIKTDFSTPGLSANLIIGKQFKKFIAVDFFLISNPLASQEKREEGGGGGEREDGLP